MILAVFLGGGIGSVCRFLLGNALQTRAPSAFPVGTLAVNVVGCLAIGLLAGHFLEAANENLMRTALVVGFCGGFTTFSAFSFETFSLLTSGRLAMAAAYVAISVLLCLAGTWAGYNLRQSP